MALFNRRSFLKALPVAGCACALEGTRRVRVIPPSDRPAPDRPAPDPGLADSGIAHIDPPSDEGSGHRSGGHLHKIQDFDRTYDDDYLLAASRVELLEASAARVERALRYIGHGHFNLVSFDELLKYAARYSAIGAFPRQEIEFLDEIFHTDAANYGFFGDKVLTRQTAVIAERDVKKIAGSGHYLLRGEPLARFDQIRRDLGERVVLTSGVRGIAKQYQLFLSKAVETGGNLSQASRSLAPPGYSYHAIGDFDIGRVDYGLKNFSAEFALTPEYRQLIRLGYVEIRYTETNPFGVRHEPWHIKIA